MNRIYKTDHDFAIEKQKKEVPYIYMRVSSYKKNCTWMHFQRSGYELVPEMKKYDEMIEYVDGFVDDGTSSTKIRLGYIHNKIDD